MGSTIIFIGRPPTLVVVTFVELTLPLSVIPFAESVGVVILSHKDHLRFKGMKFSLFSAGALALAGVASAGGQPCGCSEVVVWETETVWVTVAPGYRTPSSYPLATAYPTSCTQCGHTLVGNLPQYIQTEVCTTVTCNDGKVLPTTWTTGSTCWVNTYCTVDKDGKTHGLDPITRTVTPCQFPTATLLPVGCEYETCVIPSWVIDSDGHMETVPACIVTWTWYPGPSYYPEPYEYTTTKWNKGTPVISIINNIFINIVTPTGSVWVGGNGHSGNGGPPSPTGGSGPNNHGKPPAGAPAGSPPSGVGGRPSGPPAPGSNGGNGTSGDNPFVLLSSDGSIGIIEQGKLVFVPANSTAAQNSNGMVLNDGVLSDGHGNVGNVDPTEITNGKSSVVFQSPLSRMLFRRAGNGTTSANGTLSWDFNSDGELEASYGSDPLYFFNCFSVCEVSLILLPGNCSSVTLTSQRISSGTAPSDGYPPAGAPAPNPAAPGNSISGPPQGSMPSAPGNAGSPPGPANNGSSAGSTPAASSNTSNTNPSSTTPSAPPSGTPADFAAQIVQWHNTYRARHGSPAVVWNDTLAAYALNYSQYCSTDHSDSPYYGENLAYGGFTNPAYYVYLWYNEIGSYNFSDPGFSLTTGHFTQIVWKTSLQIGCGWVYNHCNSQLGNSYPNYLACEYYPYGNVDGEFADEVPPVLSTAGSIPVPPGDLS